MTVDQPFDPGSESFISLATYRRDGREVRTPVWISEKDDIYYVFSEAKAGKVKRINNNGRMSIAACDMRGSIKSDWVEGSARIITDDVEIATAYRAFDNKYGWQMRITTFFSRLSGRYNKRAIIALNIH